MLKNGLAILKSMYLTPRFYLVGGVVMALFITGHLFRFVNYIALFLFLLWMVLVMVEIFYLYKFKEPFSVFRRNQQQFSLGDENMVRIEVQNHHSQTYYFRIVDEIPYQFQIRDFEFSGKAPAGFKTEYDYPLTPRKRGEYLFGDINVFLKSVLGILERRIIIPAENKVQVFPSVVQMKKYEFMLFANYSRDMGIKKVRRLGTLSEFEQIKNYVQGDDYRHINWKATSRRGELMVNQYSDEKSQQIYMIIDKSRSMKMPFNGLSLLDYAINSSLVMSNIALRKHDRAGLLTFSDKLGQHIKAERRGGQLGRIMESLYRQKTRYKEANFELLHYGVRRFVNQRSLLILFTNFESLYSMQRALPELRRLNKHHLLVVVFFKNTELLSVEEMEVKDMEEVYFQSVVRKLNLDKEMIAKELQQYGIQTVLTTPEDLSVNTINKYIELKARGMI